jgi:hypothetical protein
MNVFSVTKNNFVIIVLNTCLWAMARLRELIAGLTAGSDSNPSPSI